MNTIGILYAEPSKSNRKAKPLVRVGRGRYPKTFELRHHTREPGCRSERVTRLFVNRLDNTNDARNKTTSFYKSKEQFIGGF